MFRPIGTPSITPTPVMPVIPRFAGRMASLATDRLTLRFAGNTENPADPALRQPLWRRTLSRIASVMPTQNKWAKAGAFFTAGGLAATTLGSPMANAVAYVKSIAYDQQMNFWTGIFGTETNWDVAGAAGMTLGVDMMAAVALWKGLKAAYQNRQIGYDAMRRGVELIKGGLSASARQNNADPEMVKAMVADAVNQSLSPERLQQMLTTAVKAARKGNAGPDFTHATSETTGRKQRRRKTEKPAPAKDGEPTLTIVPQGSTD